MKMNQLLCCYLLLLVVGFSCKKKKETPVTPTVPVVYIGGYGISDGANPSLFGVYWKNGVATAVPGTRQIFSVAASGNTTWILSDSGYRTNGVYTPIPDISGAFSMFVVGTDVYVVAAPNAPAAAGIYWKNGKPVALPVDWNNGNSYSVGNASVCVKGADVYACGRIHSSTTDTAVYWKNGQMSYLPDGYAADGIQVVGNDIYIMGRSTTRRKAHILGSVYWKNGVQFPLPDDFSALAIKAFGSDIYIVGNRGSNPMYASYLKNGVETRLSGFASAEDIAVSGSDVHVVGFGQDNYALHWKNGVLDTLGRGIAQSIFITQ